MIKSNIKYLLIILLSTLSNAQNIENQQKYDSIKTISFSAVGDLMCHGTQLKYAKLEDNTFDFNPNYVAIKKYLSRTDFTIGNYETVTNKNKKYKGYPVFNTPPEYLEALKNAGFDFLTTTNNHATDGRKEGVLATIDVIDSLGLHYIGTFKSRKDRDSIRIYEKHDIKFSILSYSYGVNIDNLRADDNFMVNLIDTSLIKSDIQM
jgi:poly-gamma-glutamate capsule biosynthesis protein CapA/YwtB (metallophosphatase superfamily)